jgi:cytochrome c oxidase cbb3-type subunit III
MSDDKFPIEDKPYDGIVEDNNPLPGWWKTILYACTVFAIAYMVVVHSEFLVHSRPDLKKFEDEMAYMKFRQDSIRALKPPFTYGELTTLRADRMHLADGKAIFTERCVACHSTGGAGNIGPNLTDDFWIHGARVDSVAFTVLNGVAAKGMPTWGNLLSDEQIKSVAIYVKSLRGTNPPNPKAPQGVLDTL